MTVKDTLSADLKAAMKARDELKKNTLRLVLSAFTYAEKERGSGLTDSDFVDILAREVKKRREAAQEYAKAERADLSEKETAEAEIILAYLPAQLSEAEIEAIVADALKVTGASGPGDIGKVMGAVIPKTRGVADGKLVSDIVRRQLG